MTLNEVVAALLLDGAQDTAAAAANFDSAEDLTADVWSGEEHAEIRTALRRCEAKGSKIPRSLRDRFLL